MTDRVASNRHERPTRLEVLLIQAQRARARRHIFARIADGIEPSGLSNSGANDYSFSMREELLEAPLSKTVRLSPYLTRLTTRQMLATSSATSVCSKIAEFAVPCEVAKALAVAMVECLHAFDTCAESSDATRICVAAGPQDGFLVIGLGIDGAVSPVPSLEGARALARASKIVEAIGGGLVRGCETSRMIVGITLDATGYVDYE